MKKKALIHICLAAAVLIVVILVVVNVVIPGNKYKKASELLESGDYTAAAEAFTALGDYKDSKEQAADAQKKLEEQIERENLQKYKAASALADKGRYSDAHKAFEDLGDYSDSPKKSEEMRTERFYEGTELFSDGEFEKAYDVFTEVSGWTWLKDYAVIEEKEPGYWAAECLFRLDRFEDAHKAYLALDGYADSAEAAQRCLDEPAYRDALALYEEKKYKDAKKAFDNLHSYADSEYYSELCSWHLKYNSLKEDVSQAYQNVSQFWEKVLG